MAEEIYNSSHTGAQIDEAVKAVLDHQNVWNNQVSRDGDTMTGGLEITTEYGTISIDGGRVDIFDADGEGFYIIPEHEDVTPVAALYGIAGDENVILRGVESPMVNWDAANKKYVDDAVADKAPAIQYGTADVTAGSASPYPEGTLYVVIE